ncbi:hypothetical protein EAF00_006193 [Botryotinia globosa]|nr:hypothetical protein EAF00_006193 [Botryotinia globosa]
MEKTEIIRQEALESGKLQTPIRGRRVIKRRGAENDANIRHSLVDSNNILVVQEQNSNEAHGSLEKDRSATHHYENIGSKSANVFENKAANIVTLTEGISRFKIATEEKTPEETWNELADNLDRKMARYRSLDVVPDPSWLESILSKVNSVLEKTADGGQLKGGDKDSAIEHRNDVLRMLMQGALELGSYILDSPEIARKLAAQHGIQNEDLRNAIPSIGTGTDNSTDENINIASTLYENCCDALAPHQAVEVMETPIQESRDRSIWFEYHPVSPQGVYYNIDLYERVHTFKLSRLYVPIKSPPPTRRRANFDASKVQIFNAISGWASCPNPFILNKTWTEKVQELCQVTGYQLEPCKDNDRGIPGRYNACHAEKQVLAYWLDNYVLSSRSTDPSVRWDKKFNDPIMPEYYEGLFIVVSTTLCDCCDRFLNHVATYYHIFFTINSPDEVIEFPKLPLEMRRDD